MLAHAVCVRQGDPATFKIELILIETRMHR
jgi:hypothetical protein